MAEERIAHTQVRGHRAPKISGQQYCAEYGGPRNRVQHGAEEQKDSKRDRAAQRQSQVRECVNDGRGLNEFNDGVRNQEKYNQSAENAPGPEALLRNWDCLRIGLHESFLQTPFNLIYNKFAKSFPFMLPRHQPAPRTCPYPPAIAPMMSNGSAPDATASGRGASGGSCERSSAQAKNRKNARRSCVT